MSKREKSQTKEDKMNKMEIAEKLAEIVGGNVWAPKKNDGPVRLYLEKGYAVITGSKVNIDKVGGHFFDDVKTAVTGLGLEAFRG